MELLLFFINTRYLQNKVSFASGSTLVREHSLDDAEEVRKGQWEEMAVDRLRFERRIEETAAILKPILNCNHRAKVLAGLAISEKSEEVA